MGSATATKTHRKNNIGDFFADVVNGDVMRKYLTEGKIPTSDVDPANTDEGLAVALTLYFREQVNAGKIEDDDMAKCAACGGEGPCTKDVPACAFCGNDAPGEDEDATDTAALAAQVEAEEPKKSKKKNTPEEKPEAIKETKKTMTQTQTTVTNGKSTKKNAAKVSTALAVAPKNGESAVLYTDKDLDKAVSRVIECKKVASVGVWALGEELKQINEKKLWKLRIVKGKQAYTSFDQFCELEAKIGHSYAYQLIDIATTFTSAEVNKFGTSKLTLMLKVAEEDRPGIREKAAKMSKRQLAVEVAKTVKERGHGAKKKKNTRTAAATKAGNAKRAVTAKLNEKITIASIEGSKKVKLYAKPDSIRNVDWKSLKRAKTPAALPFGRLELTNEVTMFISIVSTDDGLEAIINVRRDTSE